MHLTAEAHSGSLSRIVRFGKSLLPQKLQFKILLPSKLQFKILRNIMEATFYVTNQTLHSDLLSAFVLICAINGYNIFHGKLTRHPNPLVRDLSPIHIPYNPKI